MMQKNYHNWIRAESRKKLTYMYGLKDSHFTVKLYIIILVTEIQGPINIKMLSYHCRKSYCGDRVLVRSSYLHKGISYTSKMTSL